MREPLCLCDRWLRRVWKGSWWAPISAAVDLSMALSASWTNSHVALLSTWLKAWMVIDFRLCQTLCQLLWTMNAVHFLELKIFLVSFIDEGFGPLFHSSNAVLSNRECYGTELVELSSDLPLLSDPCGAGARSKRMCLPRMDHHHYHEVWWLHPRKF